MERIKFYRGLKSSYVSSNYIDGIYFAVDSGEILVNNKSYSGVTELVDDLTTGGSDKALSAEQGKYLKEYIDSLSNSLLSAYRFKGTVNNYEDLKRIEDTAQRGDVYNVIKAEGYADGTNFAWTGTRWDSLGGILDLSAYYTKEEVQSLIDSIKINPVEFIDKTKSHGVYLEETESNKIKVVVKLAKLAKDLTGNNNAANITGATTYVGSDISEKIGADITIADALRILSDSIKYTPGTGGSTLDIISSDNSISINGDSVKDLKVNIESILLEGSSIKKDEDGKIDVFWDEF